MSQVALPEFVICETARALFMLLINVLLMGIHVWDNGIMLNFTLDLADLCLRKPSKCESQLFIAL